MDAGRKVEMKKQEILRLVNNALECQFENYSWNDMLKDISGLTQADRDWANKNMGYKAYISDEEDEIATLKDNLSSLSKAWKREFKLQDEVIEELKEKLSKYEGIMQENGKTIKTLQNQVSRRNTLVTDLRGRINDLQKSVTFLDKFASIAHKFYNCLCGYRLEGWFPKDIMKEYESIER
jgi:DNA repair exonuclease SbcCD ATPase subunit